MRTLALVVATTFVTLVGVVGFIRHSLDRIEQERMRLATLADSLRAVPPLESRLARIERRLDVMERRLEAASRAARMAEVVALRRWARRLDKETQSNRSSLTGIERRLDSLEARGSGKTPAP